MRICKNLFEFGRLAWYLLLLIPALPELIAQGKYEEDPEGYALKDLVR